MGDIFAETGMSEEMVLFYVVYLITVVAVALIFGVISYIFQSIGMSTIAKRRGIHKPWLAWVPVANMWLLGCISDQFRYVAYGESTNRRRKLLVRNIILQVVLWAVCGGLIYTAVSFLNGQIMEDTFLGIFSFLMLGIYALLPLAVITAILQYKCLFDLYRSCVPSKAVLFLLLSILVGAPMPFLIFACRNKDAGMSPKQETTPQYRPELSDDNQ